MVLKKRRVELNFSSWRDDVVVELVDVCFDRIGSVSGDFLSISSVGKLDFSVEYEDSVFGSFERFFYERYVACF